MCIFGGGARARPPALPPPPAAPPSAGDADVNRARADEQARIRALSGSGSTMLTTGKSLDDAGMMGNKAKLGQ
jgi:hypothetical protein